MTDPKFIDNWRHSPDFAFGETPYDQPIEVDFQETVQQLASRRNVDLFDED